MSFAEFYITDGVTQIDLLAANRHGAGWGVAETVMSRPTRTPGPRLGVAYETVDEVHRVNLVAPNQDQAAGYQQTLGRLLEQAARYFDPSVGNETGLVWIYSRAANESLGRYAVVYGGGVNDYGDIFGQAFAHATGRATLSELELALTRSPWLANPPREPACIPCRNNYGWHFSGEAWQNVFVAGGDSTTMQFTDLSVGDCEPTEWLWEVTTDDGGSWTSFSTAQNPTYILTTEDNYGFRLTATCADGTEATVTKYLDYTPDPDPDPDPETPLLPACAGTQTCYRDILTGQPEPNWSALITNNTIRSAINGAGQAFSNLAGSGVNVTLDGTNGSTAAGGYGITTSGNAMQFGVNAGENYGLLATLSAPMGMALYVSNLKNAEVLEIQSDQPVVWFKATIQGAGVAITGSGTTHLILDADGDADGITGWVYVLAANNVTFYYTSATGSVNVQVTWRMLSNAFAYYADCTSPDETVNVHTLAVVGSVDPLWELINCNTVPETP